MKALPFISTLVLFCFIQITHAAETSIGGKWTISEPRATGSEPDHLLELTQKDGKWTGKVVASRGGSTKAELAHLKVEAPTLKFALVIRTSRSNFTIQLPKDAADVLYGFVRRGESVTPVELHRTTLQSLNRSVLDQEILKNSSNRIEVIRAAQRLVRNANDLKAKPAEVKAWADKASAAAAVYGDLYQREVLLDVVQALLRQDDLGEIALVYAQQAEKTLTPQDLPTTERRILMVLEAALSKAGKADEAALIAKRIEKIDFGVRVIPYDGRAGASDRVVVVELFTGAECPPCVAADLAFDGLQQTYKPSEVVLLQYHLHIPGPDPLTNADNVKRWDLYRKTYPRQLRGTPTILFNGNPGAPGGGSREGAQAKYQQYNQIIQPLLEKAARAKLKIAASRTGDKITIDVDVADVKDNAETTRLRLAVVEKEVHYEGGNKLPKHHFVVRGFVDTPKGIPLSKKALKKTLTYDVAALKSNLKKYLDEFNKSPQGPFPREERPMKLEDLYVVGIIQDDNSYEIVQASQAKVEPAK